MYINHKEQDGNKEVFFYKCRNPNCSNFGYSKEKIAKKEGAQLCCDQPIAYITLNSYALPSYTDSTARLNRETNVLTVVCPKCGIERTYNVSHKVKIDV